MCMCRADGPRSPKSCTRARSHARSRSRPQAVSHYTMALRISPAPSAVLHSNRAAAYCSLGKYGPALEDATVRPHLFSGSAARTRLHAFTRLQHTTLSLPLSTPPAAPNTVPPFPQAALSLDPANPKYWVRKAGALMGAGQLSDAGDAYEQALEIEPGYGAALEGAEALAARMAADMGGY
jgi:tetratricopeptide (TPR) repeat protein